MEAPVVCTNDRFQSYRHFPVKIHYSCLRRTMKLGLRAMLANPTKSLQRASSCMTIKKSNLNIYEQSRTKQETIYTAHAIGINKNATCSSMIHQQEKHIVSVDLLKCRHTSWRIKFTVRLYAEPCGIFATASPFIFNRNWVRTISCILFKQNE